jgi:beta-ribofuranosylaminobenzene 5'-phosphate synthase
LGNRHSTPLLSVTVSAPARLHLGFLDLNGGLGRRFGSIGLSIGGFETQIAVTAARRSRVSGPDSDRLQSHLETMRRFLGSDEGYVADIVEAIPLHIGLGSGTQMALAAAAAMRRLHGLPLDHQADAIRLGRGTRSGIGIALFDRGGLVVDGGRGPELVAPVISELPFPERWRVLVVVDPGARGIHGAEEHAAFEHMPEFPANDAAHLCRLVLMKALPAVAERHLVNFGAAIGELQARLGDYYGPLQGGRFISPLVGAALALLEREGAVGIGQSSWGPTGFAFIADQAKAERAVSIVCQDRDFQNLDIRICQARNRGADVVCHAGADAPS